MICKSLQKVKKKTDLNIYVKLDTILWRQNRLKALCMCMIRKH